MSAEGARRWEDQVLLRLRAGDDAALALAYDQYGSVVLGLAARVVGRDRAQEVTQDVFTHLWQHPERVDPSRGSLRSYLTVMARRRSIDLLRRTSRSTDRELRASHARRDDPPSVEEAAFAELTASRLRRLLDDLPDAQRTAIELAFFDGLTYREVAAATGVAEGTAKSRLRLGLGRLSSSLGPTAGHCEPDQGGQRR